ncbi:VOC family protein [Pelagibacterium limicola]|uniref:VOC family protein n=1 Tax=Pelagibacterium limicola TaxID=2791022 RepID=UPI0018AF55BA|nr:VOC family protein [Pelagibacterium limicola]
MAGTLKEIVIDCRNAAPLARFWADLLDGYAVRAYDDGELARLASLGLTPETDPVVMVDGPGPTLCFHEIERGRAQGRLHLDLRVQDRRAERDRLIERGASMVREAEGYTVMADPEGNHFCLVE